MVSDTWLNDGERSTLTESIQCNTRVVDDEVNTISMGLFEIIRKRLNALAVCDVQSMELYLSKSSIIF